MPIEITEKAKNYAEKILIKHDYIGVMAIEFFVDKKNNLIANETASRVHNSGHITLNNSNSSQFDQHVRAVCNLEYKPLDEMKRGFMLNILGEDILKFRNSKIEKINFFLIMKKKKSDQNVKWATLISLNSYSIHYSMFIKIINGVMKHCMIIPYCHTVWFPFKTVYKFRFNLMFKKVV